MKTRYRLICRGIRGGAYYCVDTKTGKRTSLGTTNADDAQQVIEAKNNSERQPVLNLQIAKAYLAGSDNGITTRTWEHAIEALTNTKQGANQHRWKTAAKDKAFLALLPQVIIETKGEMILKVLQMGTVSTNVYLRGIEEGDYRAIRQLPKARVKTTTNAVQQGTRWILTTELSNSSPTPAIMTRLKAVREQSGDRILPAIYSDNYIALMPGERRTITTELNHADTRGEKPRIVVGGFNVNQA